MVEHWGFCSNRDITLFHFSEHVHVRYAVARPSVVCNARARLRQLKFSTMFLRHLVGLPWPSIDIREKFYGDRPRGTPPSGELNTRGVAKYSDFGPIEGYILETVQYRR